MADWKPISTAPRDGTEILLWRRDCGVVLGRWVAPSDFMTEDELVEMSECDVDEPDWFGADFVSGYRISNDGLPTHWMALPEPPT